jgi:hypothetical protein
MTTTSEQVPGKIYKQMAKIMADVGPVAKTAGIRSRTTHSVAVDDVYLALQSIMAKHGVFSLPTIMSERTEDRTTKSGSALIYRVLVIKYTFYAEDGSFVDATVVGEGMDSGDKASNKAMSVGDKYTLLQAFKIPTDDPKDPENDSPEPTQKAQPSRTGNPQQPEIVKYDGTTQALKNVLQEAAKRNGITSIPELKSLSQSCIGIDMRNLQAAVKEWAEGRNQEIDTRI